jgi:hypothetical protein
VNDGVQQPLNVAIEVRTAVVKDGSDVVHPGLLLF